MDNKENVPNGGNNERPPKIMLSKVPGMQLGEGAFGTVCAYWDKRNNYYAVKEINEKNKKGQFQKAVEEGRIWKTLKHDNILLLFGEIAFGRTIYFITELMDGDIFSLITEIHNKVRPIIFIKRCMLDVCQGIKYLHENDIIHRDIKPGNILYNRSGKVRIADFGQAIKLPAANLSKLVGTPGYRAPELMSTQEDVIVTYGKPIDIWSLGCLFLKMFRKESLLPAGYSGDELNLTKENVGKRLAEFEMAEKDLLLGMLNFTPDKRMAIDEVLSHEWFTKVTKGKSPAADIRFLEFSGRKKSELLKLNSNAQFPEQSKHVPTQTFNIEIIGEAPPVPAQNAHVAPVKKAVAKVVAKVKIEPIEDAVAKPVKEPHFGPVVRTDNNTSFRVLGKGKDERILIPELPSPLNMFSPRNDENTHKDRWEHVVQQTLNFLPSFDLIIDGVSDGFLREERVHFFRLLYLLLKSPEGRERSFWWSDEGSPVSLEIVLVRNNGSLFARYLKAIFFKKRDLVTDSIGHRYFWKSPSYKGSGFTPTRTISINEVGCKALGLKIPSRACVAELLKEARKGKEVSEDANKKIVEETKKGKAVSEDSNKTIVKVAEKEDAKKNIVYLTKVDVDLDAMCLGQLRPSFLN